MWGPKFWRRRCRFDAVWPLQRLRRRGSGMHCLVFESIWHAMFPGGIKHGWIVLVVFSFAYLKAYAWQPGAGQAILAACWPYVGPMLTYVGPMLAHVAPSWELCWGHVWAIYVETILRCQFFRSGPPPGAQNHVKTEVLQHRQDEIPCRRRARNTEKNDVLEHRKHNTRKLQGLQLTRSRSGVNRGWVGRKGDSAYSGQGHAAGHVLAVRRREGLHRTPPPPKTPAFCGVLCSSHFFPFSGSCGSRWVSMGQHSPQDGPT